MNEKLLKIQEIFRDILDDETLQIDADFSRTDCPDWDSVAMLQIILALESEFGVRFSTEEVANMKSVGDILKKLS
jgi:acyl carrier protein